MKSNEIVKPFFIVWVIVSISISLILISSFYFQPNFFTGLLPPCESTAKYGKECPLCGMTTAFFLISQGNFSQAAMKNKFSGYLYFIFALNEALFVINLATKERRKWHFNT